MDIVFIFEVIFTDILEVVRSGICLYILFIVLLDIVDSFDMIEDVRGLYSIDDIYGFSSLAIQLLRPFMISCLFVCFIVGIILELLMFRLFLFYLF